MSNDSFENEIRETFLQEATELLEQAESKFIELEKDPEDKDILDAICRLAHNIKGSGKSVGYDELSDLCHQMENLLVKLRDGSIKVTSEIVDLLLQCSDQMKSNIDTLVIDKDAKLDNSEMIEKLNKALNDNKSANVTETEKPAGYTGDSLEQYTEYQDLGTILINNGKLKPEDVEKASKLQKSKIGEILVDQGVIKAEDVEEALREQKQISKAVKHKPEEFIRISLAKIDNLLNYFGEQVILQSTLEFAKNDISANKDIIVKTITQLSKITHDLQQTTIALRMISIKGLFAKMERVVRDTSKSVEKEIEFITSGENNELDKTILEAIVDPLLHMVRNAVDHGIETKEERRAKGKNPKGKICLDAYNKGGFFYIEVKDDGKGLDKQKILDKALKLKMIDENHNLSDKEIYNLIFSSGFSTKEKVTDISGRGVGMDVVKTSIEQLKGICEVESEVDKGSRFIIRLPLTLAIFNGMIVKIAGDSYVFSNSDIEEAVIIKTNDIRKVDESSSVVNLRDRVIPIVDVGTIVIKNHRKKDYIEEKELTALIATQGDKKYALLVDELIRQQRVVHKNIGEELKNTPGVAGGTILGDGKVALILETAGLISYYKNAA